jgi:hypothetical protein
MTKRQSARWTAILFFIAVVMTFTFSTLLQMNFDWPGILNASADRTLTEFQAGGQGLVWTWLGMGWSLFPLIPGVFLLGHLLQRDNTPYIQFATYVGAIAFLLSMIGFLRWVFVIPHLADMYADPVAYATTKAAVIASFEGVRRYGDNVIGVHLGQAFTMIWIGLTSIAMLKSAIFQRWVGYLGLVASVVYLLGQSEALGLVLDNFPVVPGAGLIGAYLWALWMLVVAIVLLRVKSDPSELSREYALLIQAGMRRES